MKTSLTAALVLVGSLGAASAAMAATPVVHHARPAEHAKASPVTVMSETPTPHPTLSDVFRASDGALYTPVTHDPRSNGLPEY